jgi:putative transposase
VRRKWTYQQRRKPGRPPIDTDLEHWILQVAKDNPGLGYEKLAGELHKLGFTVSKTTVSVVLERHGVPPAPKRGREGSSWRVFLNHYKDQFLACAFFTVETLGLKTLYILFFLAHSTRRVHLAGCTAHSSGAWVTQQARQMTWAVQDRELPMRYLIHDHDTKFTDAFDTVFEAEGVEIVDIPYQAPNANAFAERWVRSVREECLDRVIILNERHLRRVLHEYVAYYNARRHIKGWNKIVVVACYRLHRRDRCAIGRCWAASSETATAKQRSVGFPRGLVFGYYGVRAGLPTGGVCRAGFRRPGDPVG